MGRSVAVTGSGGFVGRAVVRALLRADATTRLRVLVRDGGMAMGDTRVHMVPGDVTDAASVRRLVEGSDAVVHLAGVAHTRLRGDAECARAYAVNVEGTRRVMESAAEAGVRVAVLMSSAHVYRGQCGVALGESSAVETTDGAARGDYAGMKLLGEQAALAIAGDVCAVTVLRPCLVYGPGARANLLALLRAVRGGYYVHPGGADALRSFVSVETLAAAVVHAVQGPGGVFNVADRQAVRLREWVDGLADALGATRPHAVPVSVLKAAAVLGSAAAAVGLPSPLTQDSLRKLTADFSLDVSALERSGFVWPGTDDAVRDAMAAEFAASVSA